MKRKTKTGPASGAILLGEAYETLSDYTWLVHNWGGIELNVVAGPFSSDKETVTGMINFLRHDAGRGSDGDTLHTLSFGKEGPELSDFSGEFMDTARKVARGDGTKIDKRYLGLEK
jgi:hypothetical protein